MAHVQQVHLHALLGSLSSATQAAQQLSLHVAQQRLRSRNDAVLAICQRSVQPATLKKGIVVRGRISAGPGRDAA